MSTETNQHNNIGFNCLF